MKEESEKVGLKLNIQKTKIIASGPITSWQIDGETVETVSDVIFWGFKITADGDCSHEIKRRLLFGRKVMTTLDSILKSRDITLPTKVHLVKGMVFPMVMYGCESWTVKKAERQRIDAFELWCWRRLLDCKEIQPIHSEGDQPWDFFGRNDAKAETPVLWPPHVKSWLIGKYSDAGRDWGQEEKGTTEDEMAGWHHRLNGWWVWVNSGSWWWTGRPGVLQFMGLQRVGHDWVTELNWGLFILFFNFYIFSDILIIQIIESFWEIIELAEDGP